ncbi:ubiquitin domain-containing protein 7SL RNA2-like [Argentina anserina]|uniref:ubiquitin domain-containing protein 7SL RNA2-like n=1 Tax=Argentina anserina TaxID=57926 RepID=UPI0021769198|nr:ubiquitin domain-containing protein 7SL RNA2-like [Potentilla anserina]
MDVTFEPQRGRASFSIEVGYFDTVLEIKEKVQKYQGIPASQQTLVLNGKVLHDEHDVNYCEILDQSKIQLIINSESDKQTSNAKMEDLSPPKKVQLNVKTPTSKMHVPVEMDLNDTVSKLKEKIQGVEPIPLSRLVLHCSGNELQDHRSLRECEISDNAEIEVSLRPSPTASAAGAMAVSPGSKSKLKLMVLPKCGTKKIPVEVNASDNVGELRKELQKLHQRLHFHLPQESYFFIYKQNVMDDDKSFRWHHVGQGDTIEIFNGSVTGGS